MFSLSPDHLPAENPDYSYVCGYHAEQEAHSNTGSDQKQLRSVDYVVPNYSIRRISHKPVYKISVGVKSKQL